EDGGEMLVEDNIKFTLYDTGLLIFEGEGYLGNQNRSNLPFVNYEENEEGETYADDHFIKKVIIGEGITVIGEDIFTQLHALTEISLPESLGCISNYAFDNCENIREVYIPSAVQSIYDYAFNGCKGIERFTVSQENEYYYSDDNGVIYARYMEDESTLIHNLVFYPEGSRTESYTVAADVQNVCIYNCPAYLKNITFENPDSEIRLWNAYRLDSITGYSFSDAERIADEQEVDFISLDESEVDRIEISEYPRKTSFRVGSYFSSDGLEIRVYFENGESRKVAYYSVDGIDTSTVGEKTVCVYVKDEVLTYDVTVYEYVAPELTLGETTDFELVPHESYGMYFTPAKDGTYRFNFKSDYDYTINYVDSSVMENDEWYWQGLHGFYGNDALVLELTGGVKYYFSTETTYTSAYLSVTPECIYADCDHEETETFEGKEATCTENGYTAGERCKICSLWLKSVKEIRAGHIDENNDFICDREECMQSIGIVKEGNCGHHFEDDGADGDIFVEDNATFKLYDTGLLVIEGEGRVSKQEIPAPLFAETAEDDEGEIYVNDNFIKKIVIGEGITEIDWEVFRNLHALTEVVFPESLRAICGFAFADCENLTDVVIPAGVTHLDPRAFNKCSSIESFTVDEGNESFYADEYGVVYRKIIDEETDCHIHSLTLFPYGSKMSSYTVADDVLDVFIEDNLPYTLREITFLNPEIEIEINGTEYLKTVRGYSFSTAEIYALNSGKNFVALDEVEVENIRLDTTSAKLNFRVGQSFDTTGLKILIDFADGESRTLTGGFSVSEVFTSTAGDKEVTVTFRDYTFTYTIHVYEYEIPVLTVDNTTELIMEEQLDYGMYFTPVKTGVYNFRVNTNDVYLYYVKASVFEDENWDCDWIDNKNFRRDGIWTL
ncbi:MAG: leucine-rich repeat protein, partial [Clostridia bacterium]|nr:leucine-rich repeat protein [Clostridia bacterium]